MGFPNKALHCFVVSLALPLIMTTFDYAEASTTGIKDEKPRKICEGVFYSGPTGRKHVPEGKGTMTFHSTSPSTVPDVVISGTFEGDRIIKGTLYQGTLLRFWGDMRYSVLSKTGMSVFLEGGELFDNDGNLRYIQPEGTSIEISNTPASGNPADLHGQGLVWAYVDPLAASRYIILPEDGEIVPKSCTIKIEGHSWEASPSEQRFTRGRYSFDTKDYAKSLGETVKFGGLRVSQIDNRFDIFDRIGRLQADTTDFATLRLMSESVPKTKKGFQLTYIHPAGGVVSQTNQKDRVYYENGAWCFEAECHGLRSFASTPAQDYSQPFEVCIPKPVYNSVYKISNNRLTIISTGTIQIDCDYDRKTGAAKEPAVAKFSVQDLELAGARGGDSQGYLTEGTTHIVTIPFLGADTKWTVSATTKKWATPRSSAGFTDVHTVSGTRRKYDAGDPFPPYRAVRTVTQSVDLNEVAKLLDIPLPRLHILLVSSRVNGLIPKWKSNERGFKVDNAINPGDLPEIDLAAAVWQAGGFTNPEKDFDRIIMARVQNGGIARNIWRTKMLGRKSALEYCAGLIESTPSLDSLYSCLGDLYPNACPDDKVYFQRQKQYFFSGLFFSSIANDNVSDPVERVYKDRVRAKLVKLLNAGLSDWKWKNEFLDEVEAQGTNYDVSLNLYPDHPVPIIREALLKGSSPSTLRFYFNDPSFKRGLQLLPLLDGSSREKLEQSMIQGAEASLALLRKDIDRDIACGDVDQASRDISLLKEVNKVLDSTSDRVFHSLADPSAVSSAEAALADMLQGTASAPGNPEEKERIAGFFGVKVIQPDITVRPVSSPVSPLSSRRETTDSENVPEEEEKEYTVPSVSEAPRHTITSYYYQIYDSHVDINIYASESYFDGSTGFGVRKLSKSWKEAHCFINGEEIVLTPSDGLSEIRENSRDKRFHWVFAFRNKSVSKALENSQGAPITIWMIDSNGNSYPFEFGE